MIKIKRVYDPISPEDGVRYLVDRLWPRGLAKEKLKMDGWLKSIAPSTGLCRWFGHDPARWEEFRARYFVELEAAIPEKYTLLQAIRQNTVTLLFSARDREHNNALALKYFLERQTSS